MQLTLPDNVIGRTGLSEAEFKIELAALLYEKGLVSMAGGSHLADIAIYDFQQELGKRGIYVHYAVDDFYEDLKTIDAAES